MKFDLKSITGLFLIAVYNIVLLHSIIPHLHHHSSSDEIAFHAECHHDNHSDHSDTCGLNNSGEDNCKEVCSFLNDLLKNLKADNFFFPGIASIAIGEINNFSGKISGSDSIGNSIFFISDHSLRGPPVLFV